MSAHDDPLRNLRVLREKLDVRAAEITLRRASHFACRVGCDGCCQTERSVNDVEFAALQRAVDAMPPEQRARLTRQLSARRASGVGGEPEGPCSLLLDGACAVYEDRPLICRSHGLPLSIEGSRDVCPLNFTELDISTLPDDDLVSVDTLTAILVAVNALYCQETGGDPVRRLPVSLLLTPSE